MVVDTEELVDIKGASMLAGITHTAIYARIRRGSFPAGIKVGGARLWLRDKIEDWRRQNSCNI